MNLTPLILAQVGAGMETFLLVGAMIIIGIIIIMVFGALLFLLPAAVLAGIVWFLTGNELYTGLAFLAVALLSLTRRK